MRTREKEVRTKERIVLERTPITCPKCGKPVTKTHTCTDAEIMCNSCLQYFHATVADGECKTVKIDTPPQDLKKAPKEQSKHVTENGRRVAFCFECGRKLLSAKHCVSMVCACKRCRNVISVTIENGKLIMDTESGVK